MFSIPELENFLAILSREEMDYLCLSVCMSMSVSVSMYVWSVSVVGDVQYP